MDGLQLTAVKQVTKLKLLWLNLVGGSVCHKILTCELAVMRKATAQLMCAYALSLLDYCNSLIINITSDQMYCLKKKKKKSCSKSRCFAKADMSMLKPLLRKRHWLPVKERILFKIATFAFRFFDGTLPPYLSSCLSMYTPSRTLRSSSG